MSIETLRASNLEEFKEYEKRLRSELLDEVSYALKNPITTDALVSAKDKVTIDAIITKVIREIEKEISK